MQANGCPGYDATDPILQFQTYGGQDTEKHGLCDDAPEWLEAPRSGSPIEVLAQIVRAYHEDRDWPVVKSILEEKVLRMSDAPPPARPGRCFELHAAQALAEPAPGRPTALDPSCWKEPDGRAE